MSISNIEPQALQKVLNSAILSKKTDEIIKAYEDLISYHRTKGDYAQCVTYAKSLNFYYSKPEDCERLALNISDIGAYYMRTEDYHDSEECFLQALKMFKELKLYLKVADIEMGLGMVFRHQGNFERSLTHLSKALEIYNANLDKLETDEFQKQRYNWVDTLECCGIIYGQLHQNTLSLEYFQRVLEIKEKYFSPSSRCSTFINMGVTFSQTDTDKAMEYYLRALDLMDDNTPTYLKAVVINNLGGCMEDKGDYDKSLEYYLDALKTLEASGQVHYKASFLKSIASVYSKQGRYQDALKYINSSLEQALASNSNPEVLDAYQIISEIHASQKEFETALEYRLKYEEVKDIIFQEDISSKLGSLQKKYDETTKYVNSLKREKSLITAELRKAMDMGFVGVSESIREVHRLALLAAEYQDTRVLITGESGVGKEIIARLIHYSDNMNRGRFTDVNCCAIPDTMAESEFFGYVRGAFTGALTSKSGYFEEANNGTLFLDEIGDMPMNIQPKLLRVLETNQIVRLGSTKTQIVNFRLISATNKSVTQLISDNRFRADLLYRINTIEILIPPLRERTDDIEPLLEYYLSEFCRKMNKQIPEYDRSLVNWLCEYPFPGNVRELKNMVEKAMIYADGNKLEINSFAGQIQPVYTSKPETYSNQSHKLQDVENNLLLKELQSCNGNQAMAAKKLGISYSTFKRRYNKLRQR